MSSPKRSVLVALISLISVGCGDDTAPMDASTDARPDTGSADAGPVDAAPDGGIPDGGIPDSGVPDGGVDGGPPSGIVFQSAFRAHSTGWVPENFAGGWQTDDAPAPFTAYRTRDPEFLQILGDEGRDGTPAARFSWSITGQAAITALGAHLTEGQSEGFDDLWVQYVVRLSDRFKCADGGDGLEFWKWGRLWQYRDPSTPATWSENDPPMDTRFLYWGLSASRTGTTKHPWFHSMWSDNHNGASVNSSRVQYNWYPYSPGPDQGQFENVSGWDFHRSGPDQGTFIAATQDWHVLLWHFRMSSATATPGDGAFELWIDGVQQVPYNRVTLKGTPLPDPGYDPVPEGSGRPLTVRYQGGWNFLSVFDNMAGWSQFWNSAPGPTVGQQYVYVDQVVVSEEFVPHDYRATE